MAMFQRKSRQVPGLNTTSTADISFMLLIFFLVTTSMGTDKVLPRQLPPPDDPGQQQPLVVKERNVLALQLDDADRLTCNGEPMDVEDLPQRVAAFVENADNSAHLPELSQREVNLLGLCRVSDRHVISIQASARTSFNAYFQMQNAIARGYQQLRNALAMKHFHRPYEQCTAEQRDAVAMVYPQRISEQTPTKEGGQP